MNSIPQLFFFVKYLALAEQTPIAFCADFPQGDDGVLVLLRVAGNLEPQNNLCRKIRQLNLLEHQRRVRAVPVQDIVRLLQDRQYMETILALPGFPGIELILDMLRRYAHKCGEI